MKRIVINGANGYVASNFIAALLDKEYEIIALVRGNKNLSAEDRLYKEMSENVGREIIPSSKIKVYNYSLTDKNFGLSPADVESIFFYSGDLDYFHFAASLKYDLKSRDEIFGTNIGGIENSIKIFSEYASKKARFIFVSTAYTCGNIKGVYKEQFYDNAEIDAFRNYYEQSKRFAENVVRKNMEENKLNAYIIRLSQVVGNSKTGVTTTDYGIFDFSRRIQGLAVRNPENTVRARIDINATQNLIAIDKVIAYLNAMVVTENLPTIINAVSKAAIRNQLVLDTLHELCPITIKPDLSVEQSDMSSLERIVSIGMSFTSRYTDLDLQFDTTNLDSLLNIEETLEENEASVRRMITYFLEKANSKKLKVAN